MCLIGKTQLLCMQCRGIGPLLVAKGKSHGFSRVGALKYCIERICKNLITSVSCGEGNSD